MIVFALELTSPQLNKTITTILMVLLPFHISKNIDFNRLKNL